jgi:hypothetical protein
LSCADRPMGRHKPVTIRAERKPDRLIKSAPCVSDPRGGLEPPGGSTRLLDLRLVQLHRVQNRLARLRGSFPPDGFDADPFQVTRPKSSCASMPSHSAALPMSDAKRRWAAGRGTTCRAFLFFLLVCSVQRDPSVICHNALAGIFVFPSLPYGRYRAESI